MTDPIKILCVGDLHLGRTSSKCRTSNEDSTRFAVREALQRLVTLAIDSKVDFVLFTGDINDKNGNVYQTIAPFETEINRLTRDGIEVVMIAGNHDKDALSHMDAILANPRVHLLGKEGTWERYDWPNAKKPQLSFIGYSYPNNATGKLPLDNLPCPQDNIPVFALAHIDYLTASSSYLCATQAELLAQPGVDCWLLGHIHAPECKNEQGKWLLNPGSLQALDPGEPGIHGPWLLEVSNGTISPPQQQSFSAVQYCSLELDISKPQSVEEFSALIWRAFEGTKPVGDYSPRYSYRLELTGRSNILLEISKQCDELLLEQPLLADKNIYLDKIIFDKIEPAYDVKQLAAGQDIIATVAKLLLDLENDPAERTTLELLAQIEKQRENLLNSKPYNALTEKELPDKKQLLQTECHRLLDSLLRKKEQPS